MPANKTTETDAHRNARIIGAWRRANKLQVGEVSSVRDVRALVEGGVLVRRHVWVEQAVNLRSLREMCDFLRAA